MDELWLAIALEFFYHRAKKYNGESFPRHRMFCDMPYESILIYDIQTGTGCCDPWNLANLNAYSAE